MSARLENELIINRKTEYLLKKCPDYVYSWYLKLAASDKEATSINEFINKICLFLEFISPDIKNVRICDINERNIERFLISKKLTDRKYSDSYLCSLWSILNSFCIFLYKENYIKKNYMDNIERPKNRDLERINSNRVLLTDADYNEILQSVMNGCGSNKARKYQEKIRNRDITIVLLFMTTGMRREALREIDVDDFDFDKKELTIIDKGSRHHTYKINETTMKYLLLWLEDKKNICDSKAVFITEKGNRMSGKAIYKLIVKYTDDALGEKLSPHKLRSGFCSILYEKTDDIEKVRRMVGHSNIETTKRYIRTDNNERQESSDIMQELLKI